MRYFDFTLILSGFGKLNDEVADALFAAGCDDATPCVRANVAYLTFTRKAEDFRKAVSSAIREVHKAGYAVVRVEPDDLVTASEIARRTERSKEGIRLLAEAQRGPGGFPPPCAGLTGHSPLWSWYDVAAWFLKHKLADNEALRNAGVVRELNAQLRPYRGRHTRRVPVVQK